MAFTLSELLTGRQGNWSIAMNVGATAALVQVDAEALHGSYIDRIVAERYGYHRTPESCGGAVRRDLPNLPLTGEHLEKSEGSASPDTASPVPAHDEEFGHVVWRARFHEGKAREVAIDAKQEGKALGFSPVVIEVPVAVPAARPHIGRGYGRQVVEIQLEELADDSLFPKTRRLHVDIEHGPSSRRHLGFVNPA